MRVATRDRSSGVILANALYSLDEVKLRLGWGEHSLRAARRAGLKVNRRHGRALIHGAEILRYVTQDGGQA